MAGGFCSRTCSAGTKSEMTMPKVQLVVVVIDTPLARCAVGNISEQRHHTHGPHEYAKQTVCVPHPASEQTLGLAERHRRQSSVTHEDVDRDDAGISHRARMDFDVAWRRRGGSRGAAVDPRRGVEQAKHA